MKVRVVARGRAATITGYLAKTLLVVTDVAGAWSGGKHDGGEAVWCWQAKVVATASVATRVRAEAAWAIATATMVAGGRRN